MKGSKGSWDEMQKADAIARLNKELDAGLAPALNLPNVADVRTLGAIACYASSGKHSSSGIIAAGFPLNTRVAKAST